MAGTTRYGIGRTVQLPFDATVTRVREELAKQGFGVLTEIDVRATFAAKLGIDFRPYLILGACNPPLAHRALTAELDIGLLLPCNVIVYEGDVAGTTEVAALDPEAALALTGNDAVAEVARDVKARIERVVEAVAA